LICGEQGGASHENINTEGEQLESKKQLLQVQGNVGGVKDAEGEKTIMGKSKRRSRRVAEKWGEEKQQEKKSERRSTRSTVRRDKEEESSNTNTEVSDEVDKLQVKSGEEARPEEKGSTRKRYIGDKVEKFPEYKDDEVDEGVEMDVSEIVEKNRDVPAESSSGGTALEASGGGELDGREIEKYPADCKLSQVASPELTGTAEMETDSPRQGLEQVSAPACKTDGSQSVGVESAGAETSSILPVASESVQPSTPSNSDLKSEQPQKESLSAKPALRSRRIAGTSDPRQKSSPLVPRTRSRTVSCCGL